MDIKELLDDENIDPEKFFDEKEYITLLVNREGFSKKQNATADLVMELLEKELTREEQEEIFSRLKADNAANLLVEVIGKAGKIPDKAKLCAACWESGLDFSPHFLFFAELVCAGDFSLAMEALTVVENIEGKIEENILKKALDAAQRSDETSNQLVQALIANIRQRLG